MLDLLRLTMNAKTKNELLKDEYFLLQGFCAEFDK